MKAGRILTVDYRIATNEKNIANGWRGVAVAAKKPVCCLIYFRL